MDERRERGRNERRNDPSRVLTLSDGVFAIVITLLVLEIHVPDLAQGQSLREALREIQPSFVAFLISFVVVAIAWAGHRDLFALIRQTDRVLVWLSVLYLLPLSLMPFGAALLARYDRDAVALTLYGTLLIAVAASRLAIWWYATGRGDLLWSPVDVRARWALAAAVAIPAAANVVAIAVAGSLPLVSLTIYAAGPVLYFAAITLARGSGPPESAQRNFT